MGLDRLHLDQRKIKLPLAAQPLAGPRRPSRGSARSPARTRRASRLRAARSPAGRRSLARWRRWPAPCAQQLRAGRSAGRPTQYFFSVRTASACNAEIGDGRQRALGHGVHHARLGQHVDQNAGWAAARVPPFRRMVDSCTRPTRRTGSAPHPPPAPPPSARRRDRPAIPGDRARPDVVQIALDQIAAGGATPPGSAASPSSAAAAATSAASRSGWPAAG